MIQNIETTTVVVVASQ